MATQMLELFALCQNHANCNPYTLRYRIRELLLHVVVRLSAF